jgi:hypothetical protein
VTDFYFYSGDTGPATSSAEDGIQYTLAIEFKLTAAGWLKGYRFWRPSDGGSPQITGPIRARTWRIIDSSSGVLVADSEATFTLSGDGWQQVILSTAVPLLASPAAYRTGLHFPNGRYPAEPGYFSGAGGGAGGLVVGILTAPNTDDSVNVAQNLFATGPDPIFPTSGFSARYFVTPIVTDENPAGETHSGSVSAPLTLQSSAAGLKAASAARSAPLTLSTGAAGVKGGAAAVVAPLTLSATVSGTSSEDGTGPRSAVLCSPWATPEDVPEYLRPELSDVEWKRELLRASELLWMLSGRRFYGSACTEVVTLRSVRGNGVWPYDPSWGSCGCWAFGTWVADYLYPPSLDGLRMPHAASAQPVAVKLPSSPVRSIVQVEVNGEVLPSTAYRLLRSGWLERTDGKTWDTCGDSTVITYVYGEPPPESGVMAAVELALELSKYDRADSGCRLPLGVTQLARQGVTVEVANPIDYLDDGRTGLVSVDLFLRAVNPQARGQRARVWSPDIPQGVRYQ